MRPQFKYFSVSVVIVFAAIALLWGWQALRARFSLNLAYVEFVRGAMASEQGAGEPHLDRAATLAQRSLRAQASPIAYELLGRIRLWQGDLNQAALAWTESGYSLMHFLTMTQRQERAGYRDVALRQYEVLARLVPDSSLPWYYVGANLVSQERYEEAMEAYEQAVGLGSFGDSQLGLSDVYLQMGEALRRSGSVFEAYRFFLKATEADSFSTSFRHAYAFYKQAEMLVWMNRHQEALEPLERAIQLEPSLYHAYSLSGVVYARQGELARAEEFWQKAISLEPGYVWPYLHLAEMYEQTGDREQAVYYYRRVLELDPRNQRALEGSRGLEP